MSPEQATGDRVIDGRSDIYATAAVLYEMLTGDPPHTAGTTQAIIAKVLTETPPSIRMCRSSVPHHVDVAVLHALNKLPADRFAAAADFAEALAGVRAVPHRTAGARDAERGRRSPRAAAQIAAVAVVALFAGAGASVVWRDPGPSVDGPVVRSFVPSPRALSADRPVAVSPDGRMVAYGMPGEHPDGGIWVREGATLQARQISRHGRSPVFSKDGRWLAYLDGGRVMRVPVAGGTPQVVTTIYFPVGLDWTDDGRLIVVRPPHSVLVIDTATAVIDTVFRDTAGVRWPVLLPGGRELLYTTHISTDSVELRLGDIATGSTRRILRPALQARYLSTGHLVFARPDSGLYAVPFDLRRRTLTGAPVRMMDRVGTGPQSGTLFDVSRNGVAAYVVDSVPRIALFHVGQGGGAEQLRVTAGVFEGLRISPEAHGSRSRGMALSMSSTCASAPRIASTARERCATRCGSPMAIRSRWRKGATSDGTCGSRPPMTAGSRTC
jgi:eukaryotic-like serine/threonine-protein kinase